MPITKRDIALCWRHWKQSPSSFVSKILLLSIGTALCTIVFAITYSILLKALPYHDPDRLAVIERRDLGAGVRSRLSGRDFNALREGLSSIEEVEAIGPDIQTLYARQRELQVSAGLVSPGFFRFLGCTAAAGSLILPESGEGILVSERIWREVLGGGNGAIGSAVRLGDRLHVITGVVPKKIRLPWSLQPDVWIVGVDLELRSDLVALARLRKGTRLSAAQEELASLSSRLPESAFEVQHEEVLYAVPLLEDLVGHHRRPLWLLQGVAALIMLAALASLTALLASELAAHRDSFTIRMALGASHGRLFRQPMLESALIGLVSAALGYMLSKTGLAYLVASGPPTLFQLRPLEAGWEIGLLQLVAVLGAAIVGTALPLRHVLRETGKVSSGPMPSKQTRLAIPDTRPDPL